MSRKPPEASKDFLGFPIVVGDQVVYHTARPYANGPTMLGLGRVIRCSPSGATVQPLPTGKPSHRPFAFMYKIQDVRPLG